MDRSQERGAIAHNVQDVLKLFRNVATSFKQGTKSLDDQCESDGLGKLLPAFENEITRFKMWAGNLAAHQSGPASLDHRLREAPHLQEQVIYLLRDISESLEDIAALFPHGESPKDSENTQDEPALPQNFGQGSEDDFTDSDLEDDEDVSPETRLSSLSTDISEAIDCLLRLSVAIANPAPHERFRKLGAGPSEDVSFYEAYYIRYVKDKFPRASKALPDVLGKFITRRRQFFKYREAHHAKLAAGLDEEVEDTHKDTGLTEVVPKTVASSLPEHFKGASVIDEDNRSDMAMSETSYATSAGFLMQEDGQMKPAPPLKVPPPPPEAEKDAFECPFCYRMISASTRGAWKRHVFGDLRPYTCLFSRCAESNTDFDRRHRWQRHVSQYHWRTWSCPFKCGGMLPSAAELKDHIRHQHLPNASDEHLSTLVARGEVSASDDISEECPLCGHVVYGLNSYIKHVGRHLEQLALFVLPNIEGGVSEDDVESDEQNDELSELNVRSVGADIPEPSSRAHEPHEKWEASRAGHQVEQDEEFYNAWAPPPSIPRVPPIYEPISRTDKSEEEASAPLARMTAGKQDPISPDDPLNEAGPAVKDGRPAFTRMSRKYLSIETLRTFNVDFDLDPDPEYVLIKRWVPELEQDRMWEHTKSIREKRGEPPASEKWNNQEDPPEFEWVRRKKPGRQRHKSPALLRYLAGARPSEEANETDGAKEEPHLPSDTEFEEQELRGRGSKMSGDLATDDDDPKRADDSEAVSRARAGKSAEVPEEINLPVSFWCKCCPENPRRFETIEELRAHEATHRAGYQYDQSRYGSPSSYQHDRYNYGPYYPTDTSQAWNPYDPYGHSFSLTEPFQSVEGSSMHSGLDPYPTTQTPQSLAESSQKPFPAMCLYPGCVALPFKSTADLQRHYRNTHSPDSTKEAHFCDYPRCTRAGEPFRRRDHFRDHLREYHREGIQKRGVTVNEEWLEDGYSANNWWRCPRCLIRVYISKDDFECPKCKGSCEPKRKEKRRGRS